MRGDAPTGRYKFLVIGYGNTLRSDDGAGVRVAEEVAARKIGGVTSLAVHQLTPELAEPVAAAELAIFVDARLSEDGREIAVSPLQPSSKALPAGHTTDPPSLLTLAQSLYGHRPRAWLVTVPAVDLSIGEGISATTARCIEAACRRIIQILEDR